MAGQARSGSGKLTAKLGDDAVGLFKDANGVDGVLVDGLQVGVVLCATAQVHLAEHLEGGLFAGAGSVAVLGLDGAD